MGVNESAARRWGRSFRKDADAAGFAAVKNEVRLSGFRILQQLVFRSPVDTGAFRAHWSVTFGADADGFSEAKRDRGGNITLSVGLATLAGLPRSLPDVHFSNPTPYGPALERGWSPQAPEGIVAPVLASYNARPL